MGFRSDSKAPASNFTGVHHNKRNRGKKEGIKVSFSITSYTVLLDLKEFLSLALKQCIIKQGPIALLTSQNTSGGKKSLLFAFHKFIAFIVSTQFFIFSCQKKIKIYSQLKKIFRYKSIMVVLFVFSFLSFLLQSWKGKSEQTTASTISPLNMR